MVLVAVILILLPIKYAFSSRHSLGNLLIHLGERLNGGSTAAPPTQSVPASADRPSVAQAQPPVEREVAASDALPAATTDGIKSQVTDDLTPQVVAPLTDPPAASPADPVKAPRQPANAGRFPATRGGTVSELWRSVGGGDTNAELALARRYLSGVGVAKNCEQARVLLFAAAKRGNSQATSELQALSRRGCR